MGTHPAVHEELETGVGRSGARLFEPVTWLVLGQELRLSSRELQIVQQVFDDRREETIASLLGISPHTVNTHLQRLYRKLGVSSRTALILRVVAAYMALVGTGQ